MIITGGTFAGPVAVGAGDAIDRRQIMQNSSGGQMISFGDISGQAAVTVDAPAVQPQAVNSTAASSGAPDWPRLWQLLATLKAQMGVEAPPEKKEAALAEVGKLEQAVFVRPPNLAAVQEVGRWFAKNLSWMSRSVADVVTFIQSSLA